MAIEGSFTGRIGTQNSRFGNIVFAAVDGFGLGAPDFQAHQLKANQVRVLFSIPVTEGALESGNYVFASISGTADVPPIQSVHYYDETRTSVVVTFFRSLTTGEDYSVTVSDVATALGEFLINAVKNFTANVFDPPRAVGAFQSKRGMIDVLFDRPVAANSGGATFYVRDEGGGPVATVQVAWGGEDIPDSTLRIEIPGALPAANSFFVGYAGVTDESLNPATGEIPLTLVLRSPLPFSVADMEQLQVTDALVLDVSPDVLGTATIRVFFNGPVLDADSIVNWSVAQLGAHPALDDVNLVTVPDATDLPSLLTLVNDVKAQLNGHLTIDQVHLASAAADVVSTADATDQPTASALVDELQAAFLSHLTRSRVHLYRDTVNAFDPISAADLLLATAISAANLLKAAYNAHLASEYPLSFSTEYQLPLTEISDWTKEDPPDEAFDVAGPYTYFADLHVLADADMAPVHVLVDVISEDGGSATSSGDYTGDIVARAASAPASLRSHLVTVDESVDFRFDRNVSVGSGGRVSVTDPDGEEIAVRVTSSADLPTLFWAYNQALEAYRRHLVPGAAGHQIDDVVNLVGDTDYAILPLSTAMSRVNGFRTKLDAHMRDAEVHYHADPAIIRSPDATDEQSLFELISDLVEVLASHEVRVGPHSFAGYRIVSAPTRNVVRVSSSSMRDLEDHVLGGTLVSSYTYNGLPRTPAPSESVGRTSLVPLSYVFQGIAVPPSLASALPVSGVRLTFEAGSELPSPTLQADSVEVFFSKPMAQVPITATNLSLTGGSVQRLRSQWRDPVIASLAVIKMESIAYSVVATGLTDTSGNTVY